MKKAARETEELKEYAARVLELAEEGFESAGVDAINMTAIDAFNRGAKDRQAAYQAGQNKSLQTLKDYVDFHRHSIANNSLIYGEKKIRAVSVSPVEEVSSTEMISKADLEKAVADALAKAMMTNQSSNTSGFQARASRSPFRTRSKSPGRSNACYRCHKEGHFARECPETGPTETAEN